MIRPPDNVVRAYTFFDEGHTLPADCVLRVSGGYAAWVVDLFRVEHRSLGVFATEGEAAEAVERFADEQERLEDFSPEPWDRPS